MTDDSRGSRRGLAIAGWFLAVSYGLAAPLVFVLEVRDATFSERFEVPSSIVLVTCVVQFVCAFTVRRPSLATATAGVLTVTTLGALGAHLRIGSPLTALPAALYTAVQIWYGWRSRGARR